MDVQPSASRLPLHPHRSRATEWRTATRLNSGRDDRPQQTPNQYTRQSVCQARAACIKQAALDGLTGTTKILRTPRRARGTAADDRSSHSRSSQSMEGLAVPRPHNEQEGIASVRRFPRGVVRPSAGRHAGTSTWCSS
eukprot:scaffold16609_cov92-Isochrysis_galbana.AAC.3